MIWKNHAPLASELGSYRFPTFWAYTMSVRVSPLALLINIQPSFKWCGQAARRGAFLGQAWLVFRKTIDSNFMVNLCLRGVRAASLGLANVPV